MPNQLALDPLPLEPKETPAQRILRAEITTLETIVAQLAGSSHPEARQRLRAIAIRIDALNRQRVGLPPRR